MESLISDLPTLIDLLLEKVESSQLTAKFSQKLAIQLKLSKQILQNQVTNTVAAESSLKFLQELLTGILKNSNHWNKKLSSSRQNKLIVLLSKIYVFNKFLPFSLQSDPENLVYQPQNSERWAFVNNVVTYKKLGPKHKILKQFKTVFDNIDIGLAFLSKSLDAQLNQASKFEIGLNVMFYGVFRKRARKQAQVFRAFSSVHQIKKGWDMFDSSLGKKVIKLIAPKIRFNKLIYILRLATPVDRKEKPLTQQTGHYVYIVSQNQTSVSSNFSLQRDSDQKRIPVRVLSPFQIPEITYMEKGPRSGCCGGSGNPKKNIDTPIILHIHGGGFISMSPDSHSYYCRVWANQLNIPVFSIDYRLAPAHPFPAANDDVWQVYHWIAKYAKRHLGLNVTKIILAGDSAGGNLALGLTLRIQQSGLETPAGILCSYPASNLEKKRFTPSAIRAFSDRLLSYSFLDKIFDSYLPEEEYSEDLQYMISPQLARDQMFTRFPPVRMLVGNIDPLFDDCMLMTEKLLRNDVDVKTTVYKNAYHGLLSFAMVGGAKCCYQVLQDSISMIQDLIEG